MPALDDDVLPEGFQLLPGLLDPGRRQKLMAELSALPPGSAGQRELLEQPWCQALVRWLRGLPELQALLPAACAAVQCTLFEKSPDRNWLVALHQDLAIPVESRVEHSALKGWSIKSGRHFVLAPAEILSRLVALRLHLDDATQADGGLRIVPGSHRSGVLNEAAIRDWRDHEGEVAADALAGDALLLRPLALHASSKGSGQGRRRVLHLLFGPRELPYGLRWRTAV